MKTLNIEQIKSDGKETFANQEPPLPPLVPSDDSCQGIDCYGVAEVGIGDCVNVPDMFKEPTKLTDYIFYQKLREDPFDVGFVQDFRLVGSKDTGFKYGVKRGLPGPGEVGWNAYDTGCSCAKDYTNFENRYITQEISVTCPRTRIASKFNKCEHEKSVVDLMAFTRSDFEEYVEQAILDIKLQLIQDPIVTTVLYGGAATDVTTLADGDRMTPGLLRQVKNILQPESGQKIRIYMSTVQMNQLEAEYTRYFKNFKDEFGDLDIVVTNSVPYYALGDTDINETPATWGTSGNVAIAVLEQPVMNLSGVEQQPKGQALIAWEKTPEIEMVELKEEGCDNVEVRMTYNVDGMLTTGCGIVLIKTSCIGCPDPPCAGYEAPPI